MRGVTGRGMLNLKNDVESLQELLEKNDRVVLYGAGMVSMSVYYAIKTLYKDCRVQYFIVSQKAGNPTEIDKIPVISLEEFCGLEGERKARILVATPENHHRAIAEELGRRGLKNYICIDSRTEASLMERYYNCPLPSGEDGRFPTLRSFCVGTGIPKVNIGAGTRMSRTSISAATRMPKVNIYMVRFHRDTPLKASCSPSWLADRSWIHPLQAGAALTGERVADIQDNTGENISEKNGNYSELTALYWIWKNGGGETEDSDRKAQDREAGYLGLFHYRRVLDVTEEDLRRLAEHEIDVVLPYPTIHTPSADEHHRRYVRERDWEAMCAALEELSPEYGARLPEILSQPYFYNYNMLIAEEDIFRKYCSWLFPILERTEELSSPKGWERADRYIGYLGENLTTLYFMYHRKDFKIAHTGRLMLV